MKLEFNEGDGWQYLLALTDTRPYYDSEDTRQECSGWFSSSGDWHSINSWYSDYEQYSEWSECDEGANTDDWKQYKNHHYHSAQRTRAWNMFYEEFATVGYLIDSDWEFPEHKSGVAEWLADNKDDLAEIIDEVIESSAAILDYQRSSNCPWTWTLFDEDGDETDGGEFVYFDGENHVFAVDTSSSGYAKYRLCANNEYNGDQACTDIKVEIN